MSKKSNKKKYWMVRAGERGVLFDEFRDGHFVGVGWEKVGDLTGCTKEEIRAHLENLYPGDNAHQLGQAAGVLFRFRATMNIGDRIITYNPSTREYLRGKITGDYQFAGKPNKTHRRKVLWEKPLIRRDALSQKAKNALGSLMTIFAVAAEIAEEIFGGPAVPDSVPTTSEELDSAETVEKTGKDQEEAAREALKDRIARLSPGQAEMLVAALLRAMGYNTKVSRPGPDRGVDVFAFPDHLGLASPRVVVEVKHRNEAIGSPDIRKLSGGSRREGDRLLFVSTGGFKKGARDTAAGSGKPLELIDSQDLAELIFKHYDNFDAEGRELLPLVKMYWPV